MPTLPTLSFSELSPELFPVIVGHLPLVYRPVTFLSLALTCRRLHDIVYPVLLYDCTRLVGEDRALTTLDMLIGQAELVTKEDIQTRGNPSLSHCIRHLCIASSIDTPVLTRHSLDSLQRLMEVKGLYHLVSLTLHVYGQWDGTFVDENDPTTGYLRLPSSFLSSLRIWCPNLKGIHISEPPQAYERKWIEPEIFCLESLTSIRVAGNLLDYPHPRPTVNFSGLSTNLHTLELRLLDTPREQASDSSELLCHIFPNLRTLILDHLCVSDPLSVNAFWHVHSGIERLELFSGVVGSLFDNLQDEMLPNLRYLMCSVDHALLHLPRFSKSLITLNLCETYNAQGPYLLRVISPGEILPALRSLGIHSKSGNEQKRREGHRWREDENGDVSLAPAKKSARKFDGNYIMSLARAAPNLQELELMGGFDDTVDSLTTSLSMFSRLRRLTLSGPIGYLHKPFFSRCRNWIEYADYKIGTTLEKEYGKYAPATFEEAVRDLADGCRTLDLVTMSSVLRELWITDGLSRKVIRECARGAVTQLQKIEAWGNIIGREDEW